MEQPTPGEPAAPSRCFICLGDAGEEGDISDWVHPCPCSLEAHHACLLEWVDECERESKPLKCPVCQAPIRVEGARDLAVDLSDGIRGVVNGFSPVVVGSMMGGAVVAGQALYGFHAVRVFAGEEALLNILGSGRLRESLPALLGVPLIAPGLVFWQLFPGFTSTVSAPFSILFSATFLRAPETLSWPPTPQLAFASMPCIAMAYMKVKSELFGKMEARWDRIIRGLPVRDDERRPRADAGILREMINNIADGLQGGPEDDLEDEVEFWFDEAEAQQDRGRIVIDVVEEIADDEPEAGEEDVAPPPAVPGEDAQPQGDHLQDAAREPQPGGIPEGPPEAQPERAPRPAPPQPEPQRRAPPPPPERAARYSIRDLTSTILGALLLPSISWAAGELLRLALPKAWTAMPGPSRAFLFMSPLRFGPTGLLQERWGRSLVGGCAWIVLKDMFRLYVKYRRAVIRPLRRVPNAKPRTQRP